MALPNGLIPTKRCAEIAEALDQEDLRNEFARISDVLGMDAEALEQLRQEILAPLKKAKPLNDSPTRVRFRFLCSTQRVLGPGSGRLTGVELEHNRLIEKNGKLRPQGTGEKSALSLDTLVFAIGDQVDQGVGLPFEWGKFRVPPEAHPRHEDRARYEVFDPETGIKKGWFLGRLGTYCLRWPRREGPCRRRNRRR